MVKDSSVISIRFNKEDLEKLEERPEGLTLSAYCKDIILRFINSDHEIVNIDALKNELKHKNELLDIVNKNLKDLQNMNGYLIRENTRINTINDRLLLPENTNKKWWRFWE